MNYRNTTSPEHLERSSLIKFSVNRENSFNVYLRLGKARMALRCLIRKKTIVSLTNAISMANFYRYVKLLLASGSNIVILTSYFLLRAAAAAVGACRGRGALL